MYFLKFLVAFLLAKTLSITIHTFGDSHSRWSRSILSRINVKIPVDIKIHHLGPILMNTFGKMEFSKMSPWFDSVDFNDILVFVFGEIDVRVHLDTWIKLNGAKKEVNRLTDAFFNSILRAKLKFNKTSIWVQGIVPPTDIVFNPRFPYNGLLSDRINYTILVNVALEKKCKLNGFKYLDFYNEYKIDNGTLNYKLSDGNVHIRIYTESTKKLVSELVDEHLINTVCC